MKMKFIVTALICIGCVLGLASCNNSNIDVPSGMIIASNKDIPDYVLFVPDEWTVDIQTGTTTAYLKSASGDVLATFVASFNTNKNNYTLDNYFDSFKEEFTRIFDSFELSEQKDKLLSGVAAKEYTYTGKYNNRDYKFNQVICFKNNLIYTLTYSATSDLYEQNYSSMERILAEFKFK